MLAYAVSFLRSPTAAPEPPLPLCQLPAGRSGRVQALRGEPAFCQRVREMGFGERAFVTKVGGHGPFICVVNGCRLALNHDAAASILVEPIGASA